MADRRWIEERRWEVDGIWRVAAGGRTDAEVLEEMGGERVERCAICADTPRKTPKGDPCGVCGAMAVEQVWIVREFQPDAQSGEWRCNWRL